MSGESSTLIEALAAIHRRYYDRKQTRRDLSAQLRNFCASPKEASELLIPLLSAINEPEVNKLTDELREVLADVEDGPSYPGQPNEDDV